MNITIEHHDGQYPSFNIMLHSVEGAEPFLTIKGCRIVQGSNGPFISYPSRKVDSRNAAHLRGQRPQSPRVVVAHATMIRPIFRSATH